MKRKNSGLPQRRPVGPHGPAKCEVSGRRFSARVMRNRLVPAAAGSRPSTTSLGTAVDFVGNRPGCYNKVMGVCAEGPSRRGGSSARQEPYGEGSAAMCGQ